MYYNSIQSYYFNIQNIRSLFQIQVVAESPGTFNEKPIYLVFSYIYELAERVGCSIRFSNGGFVTISVYSLAFL